MSFENPKGLWMLLGVPVLILIHLIKSKHEDQPVASTYLWKLADRFMKQMMPMQKLKKALIFIFQLLAVAGLALLVARPVLYRGNSIKYIAILDSSASMLTEDENGVTRFSRAVDGIKELSRKIDSGHTLSIIYAADDVYYLIQDSSSISDVEVLLDNAQCTKGSCDIDTALSLAQETADRYTDTQVVLFTDAQCSDLHNIDVQYVGDDIWNASITSLKTTEKDDLLYLTGSVMSCGTDSILPVGLEVDGQTLDVQLVECTDGEAAEVTFSLDANKFGDFSRASIFLDVEDGLADDNRFYICIENDYFWKLRLISENPRYLRSAFDSVPHVTLRLDRELSDNLSDFHMYIFDDLYPASYPDGAIVIFGTGDLPEGLYVSGISETPALLKPVPSASHILYKDMLLDSTYVSRHSILKGNSSWTPIYQCGDDTVAMARRSSDGTVYAVFGFDVHDTNLPLQSDFTVMLRNLVKYALPWIVEETEASVGEDLTISLLPYEDQAFVTRPDGTRQTLAMDQSSTIYTPTDIGVYRFAETSEEKTVFKDVFVHIPSSESLKQSYEGYSIDRSAGNIWAETQEEAPKAGTHLDVWLAAAILLLILAEWGISCREEL